MTLNATPQQLFNSFQKCVWELLQGNEVLVHLHDVWAQTLVQPGDPVHLIAKVPHFYPRKTFRFR